MLIFFLLFVIRFAVFQNICESPVNLGATPCSAAAPSLRYFHDNAYKRCLPFLYSGCGGNENNFSDRRSCRQRCIPFDNLLCPANTPPTLNVRGTTDCQQQANKCIDQSNNFCRYGPNGVGICCSLDSKRKVDEDLELMCPNRKKKYTTIRGGTERAVIGKACEHKFCPDNYDCQKGNFYAYCCSKPESKTSLVFWL